MALSPDDPCGGFQHDRVMAFINEKMAGHVKGLEFYQNNMALSWEEVEDKLSTILEDSEVPSQAKEACTWGTLALGVRFAHRQEQLQARRVQWLRDFAKLHKSAAQALASDLRELTIQKEMEHRDAAFQLQMVQNSLTEVQKERDLLRWKLLQAELGYSRQQEQAVVAASRAETYRAGEKEEDARAWTRAIIAAAVAAGDAEGGEEERDAEAGAFSTEAPQELDGGFLQYLGVGAEGGRSQVGGNSLVSFLWDTGAPGHRLTGAPSCPAPCLIHILILMPFVLLLRGTQSIPTDSTSHSTKSTPLASQLGGL
uniref:Testis expressed 13B n=1 Tax=Otolemur garnettii TaxID=30611 RepID=H0X3M6_OTOGA